MSFMISIYGQQITSNDYKLFGLSIIPVKLVSNSLCDELLGLSLEFRKVEHLR